MIEQKGMDWNHDFYVQINNKRKLINLYKDIVL